MSVHLLISTRLLSKGFATQPPVQDVCCAPLRARVYVPPGGCGGSGLKGLLRPLLLLLLLRQTVLTGVHLWLPLRHRDFALLHAVRCGWGGCGMARHGCCLGFYAVQLVVVPGRAWQRLRHPGQAQPLMASACTRARPLIAMHSARKRLRCSGRRQATSAKQACCATSLARIGLQHSKQSIGGPVAHPRCWRRFLGTKISACPAASLDPPTRAAAWYVAPEPPGPGSQRQSTRQGAAEGPAAFGVAAPRPLGTHVRPQQV